MDGWVGRWMDRWREVEAGLSIAYSNQIYIFSKNPIHRQSSAKIGICPVLFYDLKHNFAAIARPLSSSSLQNNLLQTVKK